MRDTVYKQWRIVQMSSYRTIIPVTMSFHRYRASTVNTRDLFKFACEVCAILPYISTFTYSLGFFKIGQRNGRSARLTGLCFVCFWNAISSDILTIAAFKQQIPRLLFHIYTTPKIFNNTQNSIIHTTAVLDKRAIRSRLTSFFRWSSSNRATRSDN